MKVTYRKALTLSEVLGACTIKTVGSDLFFPIIKAKSSLTGVVAKYTELHKSCIQELDMELNFDGSVNPGTSIKKVNELQECLKKLDQDEVEVGDLKLLNEENIKALINENPKLTTNDLEVIFELMLKE